MCASKVEEPPLKIPVTKIARLIKGEIKGDPRKIITSFASIKDAGEGDLTFLSNPKYLSLLESTGASAIIVHKKVECPAKTLIKTDNPYLGFAKVLQEYFVPRREILGVSGKAIIGDETSIGKNVSIYPGVFVGNKVVIGDRCTIYPGTYVGHECKLGSDTVVYPNVTIMDKVLIGNRVIIHAGAVIGSDGFGFAFDKGVHHKIPQLGSVIIEDDVEIGACTTIDRATLGNTVISSGTKIDNLVQIAHNVTVGKTSIIVAQVGISGSTSIGNNVTIGGQTGIIGHITIGNNSTIGAKSGITKSIPEGETVSGFPAKKFNHWLKEIAFIDKGPEIMKQLKLLKKQLEKLEHGISGSLPND